MLHAPFRTTDALRSRLNGFRGNRLINLVVYLSARRQSTARAGGPHFSTSDPTDQADIRRALEIAERAASSWDILFTDFLTPPVAADVLANAKKLAGVTAKAWGGYEHAERCRVCMGKEDLMLAAQHNLSAEGGVAALNVKGRFAFDAATHRDFLGACLGTGIERSKVGDILVLGEDGCQILVAPDLVEHLEATLVQVRSVSVEARHIDLSELMIPEPKIEHVRTVEASLRLDSIASAGFRMSRGKMTDIVKAGDVRVNWKPAKASVSVKSGDVISCSGKGRVEVGNINITKKGRYAVELVRYV